MNSGAFEMLIIRPAQSQCVAGEPIESLQKHWIMWAVWKTLQDQAVTQPPFQFTDNFYMTLSCQEIHELTFVLRQQMWLSLDGRSENRTKSRFSDSIPALRVNTRYRNDALWLMAHCLCPRF